ncbi:tape measure protein [Phocaeicola vulgatus]|nr:tape measure protein [Phocaeicola vulgatus]MDB1037894.1 tape measure protein [Phocaeicola vulgatus]
MVVDTSKLENAITSLAKKIDAIKGNPFEGAGKGAEETTRKTTSLNESLSRAADLLNRIGNNKIGEGSFANFNISGLKQGYSDLKKYIENMDLSKPQQKAAVEAMRYMKMELDEQRKTDEQRAQSKEKETERRIAADRRAYKASADLAKAQNYKQNTTAQGALDFSKTANTLQRQITAIEYLKKARLSLNTTDANYKSTLNQINQAIAKHNQALTDAGIKSQQLATRHRNLMDTAGQLSRQLALVFSVSQIEGYISKLANVRGEFELQQRSLEAILQNKAQADQIFNKTVQLAVKSPFQIKELVTFTKQLAAYRIESDKLYDTTKRLADVSAGLGVDMGRLILAYGQVKAAAYLRGTEVRQFTEAGINMYGELQKLFKTRDQADYTTAQIVDMISKRKVTFEDVEQVFENLTSKEGIFYNMQEIQAETLQGKISNLKDSIDVMLNSIGKANEDTLKGSIDTVKVLIDNWETVVNIAKAFAPIIASMAITVWAKKIGVANGAIGLFSVGLGKAGNAIKAFGATFKASFPLMAITAALGVFNELIKIQDEYNKRQKEAENKYYKGKVRTSEIERLSVTIDEKTSKPKVKEALNALVKEMNNEGFEIEIKANISEDEAKDEYDRLIAIHKKYLNDMLVLDYKYNADKKDNSMFWQTDVDEANKNMLDLYAEASAKIAQIQVELAKVADKGTGLDDSMRKDLEKLAKGVTESGSLEDIQEYYKSLFDFLEKIRKTSIYSGAVAGDITTVSSTFAGISSSILDNVRVLNKDLDKSKEIMTGKIRSFFDSIFNGKNYDNDVKAALVNNYTIAHGWAQDFVQQITAPIYDIDFTKKRDTDNNTGQDTDTELQRDILAERISLIKELNKEYEKLSKVMGSDKAAKTVMERYASQLKDVQMPKNIIGEAFLPNKENTAKALQELAKIITDFRKKIGAQKDANVLFDEKDADDFKKQLDKTKDNIESMFNGLDLYNKMKKEGFSDEMIKSLFGDLTTTESEIQAEIEKLAGKEGELWEKAYDDLNKKLKSKQDEMFKNRIEQYAQFINDFNNQIENKQEEFADYMKIARDMLNKTGNVKAFTDQVGNIIAKYNQDIAKIETEKFKKSGTYIEMMGELSIKSADELQALIEKLEDFIAKSASNIPADTLKIYINRLNEANEQLDKVKNPFGKSFIKGIKEITELQNKYNAEKSYQNELLQKQVELENELRDIESKRDIAKANGDDTTNFENQIVDIQNLIKDNDNSIANSSAKLQGMSTQMGKMTQGAGAVIGIIDKIVKGIDDSIQATADLFNEIKDIASSYGVDTESGGWQDLSIAMSSLSEMSTNVSNSWNSFKSGDFAGAAVSAIKSVGSVIKGINAIHDAKYERKIKRQQKNIESLQDAYEILKEKIDKAWDITSLNNATKQTTQNIDQQIRSYQEMINAEQKKKDTDDERIKEWNEAIKELQKTKEEIIKQEQMDLGGIGGESEYRDAAESFVQAWMDAFNETEDGLKALNENFNDFIENLIVKQATMRLAQARLKNLFDMIDKSVTEDSDGGISITQKELADIYAEATTSMKGLNEDLLSFVETLGYKPSKKANLSALTQSIQGVTEQTADKLAAILESVRFFVATQTTDITAIRNLLDARYSLESQAETNPMLIELKAQTGYLEIISDRIDRVFAPNSNSRGAGLRVFISD